MAWHDREGKAYPLPQELIRQLEGQLAREWLRAEQEKQRAAQIEQALLQERQRAEQERLEKLRLIEQLRQLGVDLDE